MKRIFIILGLLVSAAAMAQETASSDVSSIASVAMPTSRIPRTFSSLSMGGTDNLNSPATFALGSKKVDIDFNYLMWKKEPGSNDVNLNADLHFGRFAIKMLGSYDMFGEVSGNSVNNLMAGVGAGFAITKFLSLGGTVKYLKMSLDKNTNYSAVCGDVMLAGSFAGFNVAAGVREIGSKMNGYSLPTSISLGMGYGASFAEKHSLEVRADVDYYLCKAISIGAGAKYCWNNMVTVSGGYHAGGVVGNYATAGAAFSFKWFRIGGVCLIGSGTSFMASLGFTL